MTHTIVINHRSPHFDFTESILQLNTDFLSIFLHLLPLNHVALLKHRFLKKMVKKKQKRKQNKQSKQSKAKQSKAKQNKQKKKHRRPFFSKL